MKGKRVLLLCKETYSVPLFFLAQKLLENRNTVAVFHVLPSESTYNKCKYNAKTFYGFDKLPQLHRYDVQDITRKFLANVKTVWPDWEFLKAVERDYTYYRPLNLQLISSQMTSRGFHFREQFNYTTAAQNNYWLELTYKKALAVLDDFAPDVICDLDTSELMRTEITEIARFRGIPYIGIEYPRYEEYKLPTFTNGSVVDDIFVERYACSRAMSAWQLAEELAAVDEYCAGNNIMSKEYVNTLTTSYKADSVFTIVREFVAMLFYQFDTSIRGGNWCLKHRARKTILFPVGRRFIWWYLKRAVKRKMLFGKNRLFVPPDRNDHYIYMPLHLIPESTTSVKAPFYLDEANIIGQMSKALPLGMWLYVKEHQSMLGERPLSFYRSVARLPNVKLVQLNYYTDPKPWIENADGVVTITGTSAFEAAMLGKKSAVFGPVLFGCIPSISHITSFAQLPNFLAAPAEVDSRHNCAAYLHTVKQLGQPLKVSWLVAQGMRYLQQDVLPNEEYWAEIGKLEEFYTTAYALYRATSQRSVGKQGIQNSSGGTRT